MTGALLRALMALVPVAFLFAWSSRSRARATTVWGAVQLAGAGCLVVVVLTHICEALTLFPVMQWGSPTSVGHYLDLSSAALGLSLVPVGYLGRRASRRGGGAEVGPGSRCLRGRRRAGAVARGAYVAQSLSTTSKPSDSASRGPALGWLAQSSSYSARAGSA